MEIRSILLSLILASTTFIAAAPVGGAVGGPDVPPLVGACTQVTDPGCEGAACVVFSRQVPTCVPDAAPRAATQGCVDVYEMPDNALAYCWDVKGDCKLAQHQTTKLGTRSTCLAPSPVSASAAALECVQYMYVADYHWYWICANPKDASCPVYFKEQHGVTVTRECVPPGVGIDDAITAPRCVLVAQDLDYSHYACTDLSNPRCAAYTYTTGGPSPVKRCYGVLPGETLAASAELSCIPTNGGGMDYHSELCVKPRETACPVYTNDWTGKRCLVKGPAAPIGPIEKCTPPVGDMDYQTYFCVDSSDPSCPVYQVVWSGKRCLVPTVAAGGSGVDGCYPISGDLDNHRYLCVDSTDPKCPVYTLDWNGKHCGLGVRASAPTVQACIPTSGGLDYHTFLCVDSTDPKCAVYGLDWNGKHCPDEILGLP